MKPVDQAHIDDITGDCLRACVASICELDLGDVPNFSECGFMSGVEQWAAHHEYLFIWLDIPDFTTLDSVWFGSTPEFFMAWGMSPRRKQDGKPKQHVVVVSKKGYGVRMVHDPHPDRTGLESMCGFGFLIPTKFKP